MEFSLAWTWEWPKLGIQLNVTKQVADIFLHHRQASGMPEKGGQLFVNIDCNDGIWLSEVSQPHINDRSGPTWLELAPDRCKAEVISANQRGLSLIGYWHTHSELIPNLSNQDIKSFKGFSIKNRANLASPLAIIVGSGDKVDSIRAWSLQSNGFIMALMKNIEIEFH